MGKSLPIIRNSPSVQQLSALYDLYYMEADTILKKYNPCQISDDGKSCTGGKPCCYGNYSSDYCKHEGDGSNCPHLGERGCTVKSLACKIWLCGTATRANPECDEELRRLHEKIIFHSIPREVRADKEESFLLYGKPLTQG